MATSTTSGLQCTLPTSESAQPIINIILSDINAIMPNFSSLVSSYRLLVGASEEIHRMADICPDVWERAVRRFDNAGTLIDILLDLLCCKISFSSEFLEMSCLPVDLFRLLANRAEPCDQSHRTAEQIIILEALREALANCNHFKCFPDTPVVCPVPPTPASTVSAPATPAAPSPVSFVLRTADSPVPNPENSDSQSPLNGSPEAPVPSDLSVSPPVDSATEDFPQANAPLSKKNESMNKTADTLKSSIQRRHI